MEALGVERSHTPSVKSHGGRNPYWPLVMEVNVDRGRKGRM
jgi:hypothetical protein